MLINPFGQAIVTKSDVESYVNNFLYVFFTSVLSTIFLKLLIHNVDYFVDNLIKISFFICMKSYQQVTNPQC